MTPQLRNFYKLEKRWKDAEIFDVESYLSSAIDERKSSSGDIPAFLEEDGSDYEVSDESGADDQGEEGEEEEEEEDPFWK